MLDLGEPWTGPRPAVLAEAGPPASGRHAGGTPAVQAEDPAWRTAGDTVERLEALALRLVSGEQAPAPEWHRTRAVLGWIEAYPAAGGDRLRTGRDRGGAGWPRRQARRARPERRAEPGTARGIADRAQFLLGRYARRADPGRLAARLAFGRAARRALRAGARQLPGAARAVGLGHRQHAHRRRRHRAGAGADRRPAGLGGRQRPGHRVRNPAGLGPRPSQGRCHAAHFRVLPRRLPRPDRPVRQRGARRRGARRAAGDKPAGCPRRRRPRGARSRRGIARTKPRGVPAIGCSGRNPEPTAPGCRC